LQPRRRLADKPVYPYASHAESPPAFASSCTFDPIRAVLDTIEKGTVVDLVPAG
jgi:hypothetical protein